MNRYNITVKTGSSQEKIIETALGELIVYLRAKPHDGEANDALIKILAKHFRIPKTTISIIRGTKSHKKVIEF